MNYDVVIIGAGLSGSTAARLLADRGKKILIVERHKHIAGHCHDYKNDYGITVHTYGPHIFHTNDEEVWEFVQRFSDFHYYQHWVLSYADGQFIPFPINVDTINKVFGISISVDEVAAFLNAQVKNSSFSNPPQNFRDAVVSQVGQRLYSLFFEQYTKKQWGRDPGLLSADIAKRIPVRANRDARYFSDKYQGIPARGYTNFVSAMLDHQNITLLLGADWFDIQNDFKTPLKIFTGELDRFFDYRFGKLEYRSLRLDLKTFKKDRYQDAPVVNYPNDYDWTRITEYKKFLAEDSPYTTVCFEYPKAEGEPFYIVMTEDNMVKRAAYLEEAKKLEALGSHMFIGRLAEYKYYNMDQVISATMGKVRDV